MINAPQLSYRLFRLHLWLVGHFFGKGDSSAASSSATSSATSSARLLPLLQRRQALLRGFSRSFFSSLLQGPVRPPALPPRPNRYLLMNCFLQYRQSPLWKPARKTGKNGARRVIIARYRIINAVGVAITVDDSNHRNTKRFCFGNGNRFFIGVYNEHQFRHAAHFFNAAQRKLKLVALACQIKNFFFGQAAGTIAACISSTRADV